ncbi:hypothetical protein BC941DRAFT_410781 [Chlamydoabsidia padenii]|nr:hypothetical protein BC941DRAFT_410781 [Chlamydoabsidia padenii]
MSTETKQQLRIFSPVILFHEYDYITKEDHTTKDHSTITYGDPFHQDDQTIEAHKRRISRMLENNGRFWSDIITWSRDHPLEHSPVPSLVSSPTPPHQHQELPSPRQSPSPPSNTYNRQQQQQQQQRRRRYSQSTAGSVLVTTTSSSNSKTNKRRRGNLPKAVTAILRDWLSDHKKHPYPTEDEKDYLATRTGLTLNQISNWFINARRRILQPMLEQENTGDHQNELDILPYETPSTDDDSLDRRLRKRPAEFHRRDSTTTNQKNCRRKF